MSQEQKKTIGAVDIRFLEVLNNMGCSGKLETLLLQTLANKCQITIYILKFMPSEVLQL